MMNEQTQKKDLMLGKEKRVIDMINKHKVQIEKAVPKDINADRILRSIPYLLRKNPKLLDCSASSLFYSLIQAAVLGLELGGPLEEAYPVPYGGEIECQIGYRGLIKLAYRNGFIKRIQAEAVHSADHFDYKLGTSPYIDHKPAIDGDRGDFRVAYAIAMTTEKEIFISLFHREDVDKVKNLVIAKFKALSPAWKMWEDEQIKKCAIRRLAKILPKNPDCQEFQRAVDYDNKSAVGETDMSDVIDLIPGYVD